MNKKIIQGDHVILVIAFVVIINSLLVLSGLSSDGTLAHWNPMNAVTVLCFMLMGIVLLSHSIMIFCPKFSRLSAYIGCFCSVFVGLIGLLSLSKYLYVLQCEENTVANYFIEIPSLEPMPPENALCFIFLSIAMGIDTIRLGKRYTDILLSIGLLILALSLSALAAYLIPPTAIQLNWFDSINSLIVFTMLGTVVVIIGYQNNKLLFPVLNQSEALANSFFLRKHVLFDMGIASIIFVSTFSALVVLSHLHKLAEEKTTVITENLVEILELSIEGVIDKIAISIQSVADEVSREIASHEIEPKLINHYLEQEKRRIPESNYFYVVNEQGDIIYGHELKKLINISDREHFITLRDSTNPNLIATNTVISRFTAEWIFLVACRVNNPDGSFAGIVSTAMVLENFNNMFARIQLASKDSITLRDKNLGLMARSPSPETINLKIGDHQLSTPFTNALQINPNKGTYTSGVTSIDSISRIHSYRKNKKYGFTINVGISSKSTFSEWRKQAILIITLMCLFIIVLLIFSRSIKRAWFHQVENIITLQKNQQFLQETQKIALLGSYVYDLEIDQWISSDILNEIFGIDKNYTCNLETWRVLIAEDVRQEIFTYLQMIIEQRLPFDKEYRIVRINDGEERWVHGRGELRFNENGTPITLIGMIQDITEQKSIEIKIKSLNTELETRVRERTFELEMINHPLLSPKKPQKRPISLKVHLLRR